MAERVSFRSVPLRVQVACGAQGNAGYRCRSARFTDQEFNRLRITRDGEGQRHGGGAFTDKRREAFGSGSIFGYDKRQQVVGDSLRVGEKAL